MQPYFFPYMGYFQLIDRSDIFVFADDVQYLKRGWINRNRILRAGEACWLTLPVRKGAHSLSINQRSYEFVNARRLLRRIEASYRRAPRFDETFALVRQIMECSNANVAEFNMNLITRVADRLGITTRFVVSSRLEKNAGLTGQERVVDICQRLGAAHYVNPIGGIRLYQAARFARAGIELSFVQSTVPAYAQFGDPPIGSLSIVDSLMFNGDSVIAEHLKAYRLIRPDGNVPPSSRGAE